MAPGGVAELECPESLEVMLADEVECVVVVVVGGVEVINTGADAPLATEDDADESLPSPPAPLLLLLLLLLPLLLPLPLLALPPSSLLYWPE